VVEKAIEFGCDTIVTHHPAIYHPIKNLDIDGETAPLVTAIKNGMNVISFHLNLDVADGGIDQSLAEALGAKTTRILDYVDDLHGYGREFDFSKDFSVLISLVNKELCTEKAVVYGQGKSSVVASFCGSGGSHAISVVCENKTSADTIVTSDLAHHEIKELIEKGKKLIILPHYVAEDYGFNKFYQRACKLAGDNVETIYFQDKRFM
jgi:putative NIF3 family GTP cyclohydrolase 1 type 2